MQKKRYPGLRPFEAIDKDLFFGRDREVQDMSVLIELEKLVVLFGKSGYGKSSLINAGVIPHLVQTSEQDSGVIIPLMVRLGSYVEGNSPTPLKTVLSYLEDRTSIYTSGDFLKSYLHEESLWYNFKQRSLENTRFLLIFDQFEEFFTYPLEQQETFKVELAELLYTEIPQTVREIAPSLEKANRLFLSKHFEVKVLFIIRDDRMSQLNSLKDRLPTILHNPFELKGLNETQAQEAIVKPAQKQGDYVSSPYTYSSDALKLMLQKLSETNQHTKNNGIEAFQLQILCQYLESEVVSGKITRNQIEPVNFIEKIDDIYEGYYQRLLKNLPSRASRAAQRMIEDGLVFTDKKTGESRRLSVDADLLLQRYAHIGISRETLHDLENTFLLRRLHNSVGTYNYEVSHDTLIKPIINTAINREKDKNKRQQRTVLWLLGIVIFSVLTIFTLQRTILNIDPKTLEVTLENNELKQELESIHIAMSLEDSAKFVVQSYFKCIAKRDIKCISTYCAETMGQYYREKNMRRIDREKEEIRYFKKHPNEVGGIPEDAEIAVVRKNSIFNVTVSTKFYDDKKGLIPLIYQFQLDSAMKITVLRSYIPRD